MISSPSRYSPGGSRRVSTYMDGATTVTETSSPAGSRSRTYIDANGDEVTEVTSTIVTKKHKTSPVRSVRSSPVRVVRTSPMRTSPVRTSPVRTSVSSGNSGKPRTIHRKVSRVIEVPIQRKVKVPVISKQIVPTTVQMEVQTKQLVEKDLMEEVEEEYTELIEQKAFRDKVVWVKKEIQETYTKEVPSEHVRTVKRPVTRIVEKDELRTVSVPTNKVVESVGYRIDTVEDRKTMEVEEIEEFELQPHFVRRIRQGETVLGYTHLPKTRKKGLEVYHEGDLQLSGIDTDKLTGSTEIMITASGRFTDHTHSATETYTSRSSIGGSGLKIVALDLAQDFFVVKNMTGESISLANYTVYDQQYENGEVSNNIFKFPDDFVLAPGATVTVHSGHDAETKWASQLDGVTHLLWYAKRDKLVWNDRGDCAYLADPDGVVISKLEARAIRRKKKTGDFVYTTTTGTPSPMRKRRR